jgi:uncharacterized membrane protein
MLQSWLYFKAAETMVQEKFCEGCGQSDKCKDIYRKLGNGKGPSVVKVIVAFLLPIVVFIVSLAVFEKVFARVVDAKRLQTAFSFIAAFVATFVFILIIKVIGGQISKAR